MVRAEGQKRVGEMSAETFGTSSSGLGNSGLKRSWAERPSGTSIDRFDWIVSSYPDHPAVIESDGGSARSTTFSALWHASHQVANALGARLDDPTRVGVLTNGSIEHLEGVLGIWRAGHTAVPLDPSSPSKRLNHILSHAGVSLTICDEMMAGEMETHPLTSVLNLGQIDSSGEPYEGPGPEPSTLAQIMYTSGSSGTPKGVMQSHHYMTQKAWADTAFYGFSHGDRLSQLFPLNFAASNGHTYGALLNGGTLFPYDVSSRGIHHLGEWALKSGLTGLAGVPTLLRRAFGDPDTVGRLDSLRFVMVGGELVLPGDQDLFLRILPEDAVMIHRLAATEVGVIASLTIDANTPRFDSVLPAGFPPPDKKLAIIDRSGAPVTTGEVGELIVKGQFLSEGYWGDDNLTRRTFSEAPEGLRTYRTGDLARIRDDGALVHLGRSDARVKVRGFGVDLIEVEVALVGVEGVQEGAVRAFERVSGDNQLVGYYVGNRDLEPADLRSDIGEAIPDYMIPSRFVRMESLPLTSRGKIDRKALPDPLTLASERKSLPPGSELEGELQELWQQVLELDQIGVDESFFDLGGTSIKAYRLIADIFRELNVDLPARSLLDAPTIRDQARLIESQEAQTARSLKKIRESGSSLPLFFALETQDEEALEKLIEQLATDLPVYALDPGYWDNRLPAGSRLDELVQHLVAEVRSVQPEGPYRLIGVGNSGLIVCELARAMEEQDAQVTFVVLVGPPSLDDGQEGRGRTSRRGSALLLKAWNSLVRRSSLREERHAPTVHVMARKAVQRLETHLVLILARDSAEAFRESWRPLSSGRLTVLEFPTYNRSLRSAANRKVLAGCLMNLLDQPTDSGLH